MVQTLSNLVANTVVANSTLLFVNAARAGVQAGDDTTPTIFLSSGRSLPRLSDPDTRLRQADLDMRGMSQPPAEPATRPEGDPGTEDCPLPAGRIGLGRYPGVGDGHQPWRSDCQSLAQVGAPQPTRQAKRASVWHRVATATAAVPN